MERVGTIAASLLMSVLASTPAMAQVIKKGTLSGKIVSAAVEVAPTTAATVYTTPATGFFILTQVCVQDRSEMAVRGATLGPLVTDDRCTTYTPGVALPRNEVITCANNDATPTGACSITGVLSPK
jgi:hypothetical protein